MMITLSLAKTESCLEESLGKAVLKWKSLAKTENQSLGKVENYFRQNLAKTGLSKST